jgi:hypothetical protein
MLKNNKFVTLIQEIKNEKDNNLANNNTSQPQKLLQHLQNVQMEKTFLSQRNMFCQIHPKL